MDCDRHLLEKDFLVNKTKIFGSMEVLSDDNDHRSVNFSEERRVWTAEVFCTLLLTNFRLTHQAFTIVIKADLLYH
jgi:hypothetical protein